MMLKKKNNMVILIACILTITTLLVNARPTVRNVKTDREFQRLLKHHKEKTT